MSERNITAVTAYHFDVHSIIRTDNFPPAGKFSSQAKVNNQNPSIAHSLIPSPALLSLPSVFNTLASRVGTILDTSSNSLQTVADGFGAGGVIDGLADAAASCADEAAGGLGDAA